MSYAVQIFIAYSRKDSALLEEFREHLMPLERTGKARIWYDGLIEPGAVWEADIKKHLHASDIILLMVSAAAIASDYFYDKELADALERHHNGSARVVPMIMRDCDWYATPLEKLQAIPKNGSPVTSWANRDAAYADAAKSLRAMIANIEQLKQEQAADALRLQQAAEEAHRTARKAKEETARKAEQERLQRAEEDKQRKEAEAAKALKVEQERLQRAEEDKQRKEAEANKAKAEQERLQSTTEEKQRAEAEARSQVVFVSPSSPDLDLSCTLVAVLAIVFITTMILSIASRLGGANAVAIQYNLALIHGGSFSMGCTSEQQDCIKDESPATRVTVSDYFLGKYEVTMREFQQFINATGYATDADKEGNSRIWTGTTRETKSGVNWKCDVAGNIRPSSEYEHPVIHVSWNDAVAYCNWRSEKESLTKVYTISGSTVTANWNAKGYRLPTEAEWEYAARSGGKAVLFGNGKNIADPNEINFYSQESAKKPYSVAGNYRGKTIPVGSLNSPNALGLHDMSGNVWEWCWDWRATYPGGGKINYRGPENGSGRVIRGGSWYSPPQEIRVADRSGYTSGSRNDGIGFRLARSVN